MPLPTAPVKLGNLLPSEEYKAKARPARPARKQASEGDLATTDIDTDFAAPASASRPTAANIAATKRHIVKTQNAARIRSRRRFSKHLLQSTSDYLAKG
ncbi:hypothetical protein ACRXB1_08555, partial [Caballeronia sp. M23-90]